LEFWRVRQVVTSLPLHHYYTVNDTCIMTEIHIVLVLVTLEQNLKHACKSTAHFPFASQLTIGRDAAIENTKDGMVYKCFGQFNLTDRCCLLKGRYHKTGKEVMDGRPLLHRLLGSIG
jgi:hypothetical protein